MLKILRRYSLYDRKLLAALSRCARESLNVFLQHSVPENEPIPGTVIAIQTFGDFLGFNPHCHILVRDGCFCGAVMSVSWIVPYAKHMGISPKQSTLKGIYDEVGFTHKIALELILIIWMFYSNPFNKTLNPISNCQGLPFVKIIADILTYEIFLF